MSIGFFLDDNAPVMWRGPMLHRALEQFLQDVHWGELDVLVVDMPPGTGDVSISLGQLLPRAEALVVTTPQLLAQEVASRAATMAQKTGMRLLGVVENMTSEVFGSGGGRRLAEELEVPLLGEVPLDAGLRESGDAGVPLVLSDPDSAAGQAISEIARAVDASRAAASRRPSSSSEDGAGRGPPAPRGARLLARRRGGAGRALPRVRAHRPARSRPLADRVARDVEAIEAAARRSGSLPSRDTSAGTETARWAT